MYINIYGDFKESYIYEDIYDAAECYDNSANGSYIETIILNEDGTYEMRNLYPEFQEILDEEIKELKEHEEDLRSHYNSTRL